MKTHTEQLTEIVERVRIATETLGDDDSKLRAIAFQKLLDHELSQGQPDVIPRGASHEAAEDSVVQIDDAFASRILREQAIADYFRVGSNQVQDLFDIANEAPHLEVRADLLERSNRFAIREIALLVCGARTALGIETGTADIRKAADSHGRLDDDFISHLLCMDEIVVRGKSTSPNRLVRMRATGAECVRGIAQRLVANGQ